MRQLQYIPETYVTQNKDNYFEIYIVFAFFKHPILPISIKIPVALLQNVYICMTAISPNLS